MKGVRPGCRGWTAEEDAYLRAHYCADWLSDVAQYLQRTKHSVIGRAFRLGIRMPVTEITRRRSRAQSSRQNRNKPKPAQGVHDVKIITPAPPKLYVPPRAPVSPTEAAAAAIIALAQKREQSCKAWRGY